MTKSDCEYLAKISMLNASCAESLKEEFCKFDEMTKTLDVSSACCQSKIPLCSLRKDEAKKAETCVLRSANGYDGEYVFTSKVEGV